MKKIDSRLAHELMAFQQMRSAREVADAPRRRIGVFVQFTGDLETIKRQGLAIQTVVGNIAIGTVELEHIEKIAALDNVIFVEGERQERPQLKVILVSGVEQGVEIAKRLGLTFFSKPVDLPRLREAATQALV